MDKRALYNLLRLNYQEDDSLEVEEWQVEDYRLLSNEELFDRLHGANIYLDQDTFLRYVQNSQDPEDLTTILTQDIFDMMEKDKIYLPIFELWRRFASDRQSLSIFCDDFDRKVEMYDIGSIEPHFALEDSIYHLQCLLEENQKYAPSPQALFTYVSDRMANDLESFLYEYISDQIEMQNGNYAYELVERFEKFVNEPKWFHLLRAKLAYYFDTQELDEVLAILLEDLKCLDLEFGFEMLDLCQLVEKKELFMPISKNLLKAIVTEKDFQELLVELIYYFQESNRPQSVTQLQQILERRSIVSDRELHKDDADLHIVMQIILAAI